MNIAEGIFVMLALSALIDNCGATLEVVVFGIQEGNMYSDRKYTAYTYESTFYESILTANIWLLSTSSKNNR